MGDFKDEEKIKALRERLYSRGNAPKKPDAFTLKKDEKKAPTTWKNPPEAPRPAPVAPSKDTASMKQSSSQPESEPMSYRKVTRKYRRIVLLSALVFFVLAVGVSSLLFLLGGNTISGENIAISLNGPFTIGGGETIPLQIGITNQNTVPIDSATLIVTYPQGTQSATEEGKELFVERLPFEVIQPGETLNVSLRAVVFGEENEEKTISAEIEYRVKGSNSTFAKQAEPLRFKITSSPIVVSVDSLQKVSSGQETDIEIKVSSNSPNPLTDILVKAEYPNGFDFTNADPSPVSGQNVWLIESLDPEGSATITVTGVLVGKEEEEKALHVSVGVSNERDRYSLASIFSTATTEFLIESPFIDVALSLNGDQSGTVPVAAGEVIDVEIVVTNSLEYTIYDGTITLGLSGNALSDYTVRSTSGFYESINNTVSWEPSSVNSLREILPGEDVRLAVTLEPDPDTNATPQLAFDVDVKARRVTEGRATEELIGTAAGVAKVSSVAFLLGETGRDTSIFTDTGPLPPTAEEKTTYTLTLFAQNGTNDISDVEVTASLPVYVQWLDKTSGAGKITFNETSRTVTWNAGDIDANQSKIAGFQVSLLPSISQIGTTPTLLGEQRLKGNDRFTGSVIRANNPALTTRLSSEAGYPENIGEVIEKE